MRPANPNGAAMIVAAGGGYEFIAIGNEGVPVGRVLNAAGVTVFLLVYRLPAEGGARDRTRRVRTHSAPSGWSGHAARSSASIPRGSASSASRRAAT